MVIAPAPILLPGRAWNERMMNSSKFCFFLHLIIKSMGLHVLSSPSLLHVSGQQHSRKLKSKKEKSVSLSYSVEFTDSSPTEIWAQHSDWPVSWVTWPAVSNLWKSLHMGQMRGAHQFTAFQGIFVFLLNWNLCINICV